MCTETPRTPPLPCVSRVEAPLSGASAAATVEVDATSQASEPASQASDEEDAPSTDIYFVSSPKPSQPLGPPRSLWTVTPASVSCRRCG